MSTATEDPRGESRRWRGREPADRTATRRRQLLDAGLHLMGTVGAAGMSMRAVCREAGLTERYFYESFTNLDALQVAVLDEVVLGARDRLLGALAAAPPDPDGIFAYVVARFTDYMDEDPRRGRIMFVESQATRALGERGNALIVEFTAPIAMSLAGTELQRNPADETDIRLNAHAIFGAMAFLYRPWLEGALDIGRDRFDRHATSAITELARARSSDGMATP
ncbi:TetR/AcrR family transcriptional regulator [Nocardia blacklockiae]|uniref:TetR/AcrR family transcriptional regulator n=1 Tax=Nocardia blacklockiae TaxID=480036 RepID=UPI001895F6AE|nr:TetR/AcrR family transcriptional regulator [Nocardia blacklockiae]MBF6175079.1 TetR/AcrR family transcriptional regulator [Nocardia blacklockiae]